MTQETFNKIDQCLSKGFIIDQSQLVDTLLKGDKHFRYYNQLFNQYLFEVTLSDGPFKASNSFFDQKIDIIQDQIDRLRQMIEEAHEFLSIDSINHEIECLQADLEILTSTAGTKKDIYYWLLVPYWLACELIEDDETVLQILGCNWWGVSTLTSPIIKI